MQNKRFSLVLTRSCRLNFEKFLLNKKHARRSRFFGELAGIMRHLMRQNAVASQRQRLR